METFINFYKAGRSDEDKVREVKIIDNNFNLSPRGIREMLKLNNPIYEITSAYGHFGRKPTNRGEFSWEKQIRRIYSNCNLEKTTIFINISIITG